MKDMTSVERLMQWFQTDQGRHFIAAEMSMIEKSIARLFGAHCVISSAYSSHSFVDAIPCRRVYELISPAAHRAQEVPSSCAKPMVTPVCQLPFANASIDCFVLLHTLDFVANPHEVIREVARVIRPGGQVILVGFNPASLFGWCRYVPGLRQRIPAQAGFLGRHRVCDWLALLGFDLEFIGGANLFPFGDSELLIPSSALLEHRQSALQSSVWTAARQNIGQVFRERYGSVYCVRVRKSSLAATCVGQVATHKPVWAPLTGGVAVSQIKSVRSKPKD